MEKRRWWDILFSRQSVDRLVFLDETGASTKMARLYGWGLKSERVVSDVPHGHWQTTTFVVTVKHLIFPWLVFDGKLRGSWMTYGDRLKNCWLALPSWSGRTGSCGTGLSVLRHW